MVMTFGNIRCCVVTAAEGSRVTIYSKIRESSSISIMFDATIYSRQKSKYTIVKIYREREKKIKTKRNKLSKAENVIDCYSFKY